MKKLTYIDLFCGCGGFSLGLERAGLMGIAAIDSNPEAIAVFRRNLDRIPHILEKDLTAFTPQELAKLPGCEEIDLIVGGPPCQGFSTVRQADGANNGERLVDDARRHLYQDFLRYVKHFRPKVFVMENVLGIRSASGGEYFTRVQKEARAIGYRVHAQIEDCVKLGLPQKRRRQLFVGTRLGLPDYFLPQIKPAPRACEHPPLWEAIGDLPPVKAGEGEESSDYDMELRLVQADRKSDSIRILAPEEARQHGEEDIQLLEGRSYDFELLNPRGKLRVQANRVVKPSSIRPTIGRIDTGVETGLLQLVLEDTQSNFPVARGAVEVLSAKIDYRRDYRGMLSFIANECSELLFDVRASARMRLTPRFKPAPHNLQRQLEFLAAELTSGRFVAALQRVTAMPHQKLQAQWEEHGISRLRRGGRDLARQIGSATARVEVPGSSTAAHIMRALGIEEPSLPCVISVRRQVESLDTPENRFVKYVLTHFRDFLKRIESILKGSLAEDRQRLLRTVYHLQEQLNATLSADLFKGVSTPNILPIGSPVLQRKGGYREILLAWLKFDLASELVWKGGEDVYGAGKRDMAALYEYWLFFQLLRLFRDKFELASPPARTLFEHTDSGLNLRLKVSEPLGIEGRCLRHARQLNVRFHYNLTHERSESRSEPGSWTGRMRPDFTLSFWPSGYRLEEAESQELAVHIHFDAKYRVENIAELFGTGDEDLSQEKAEQKRGNYKRADLLKMHAYRDAIRRSEGAYILYPGASNGPTRFQGFHEILPGLGAFALKPGLSGEAVGLQHLSRFVDEIIAHVCNRATAREQSSYHHFHVYHADETSGGAKVDSPLPERDSLENDRPIPPAEHSVLVGWCESEEQLDWIRRAGLYNFRAGLRRGSIRLEPALADARHLLLHGRSNKTWPGLWRIKKRGPRIFTAEELLRNGYPSEPDRDVIYAVFDVEPDSFYTGWRWDFAKLPGRKAGVASAEPFAVRLVDVLAVHRA